MKDGKKEIKKKRNFQRGGKSIHGVVKKRISQGRGWNLTSKKFSGNGKSKSLGAYILYEVRSTRNVWIGLNRD